MRVKMIRQSIKGQPASIVPDGAVYIGRNAWGQPRSPLHNPFKIIQAKKHGREDSLRAFERYFRSRPDLIEHAREIVNSGRDLACWCDLDEPCHGDVILLVLREQD